MTCNITKCEALLTVVFHREVSYIDYQLQTGLSEVVLSKV